MRDPNLSPRTGFTLIELLVTLAIVAALASVALPLSQTIQQRAREEELRRSLWQIRDAIDAYKQAVDEGRVQTSIDDSGYPPSLRVLVEGVVDQTQPDRRKIYFLRRVPRDPMCDCPSRGNERSWGLRSYRSPPDAPHEGKDVYDIYSTSGARGLDGTPYREW